MRFALPDLFAAIHQAADIEDLRERLLLRAIRHFEAARGALFLNCEIPPDFQNRILESPIFKALMERHAPLHEGLLAGEKQWQSLSTRADHGHVLVGPIVQNGELVGSLAFTRFRDGKSFDAQNMADLSALCLHVSTRLAQIQNRQESLPLSLSKRETQIAYLVAQGFTNPQIASQLHVSSETIKAALKHIFRKAEVHSRAQLVARLSRI